MSVEKFTPGPWFVDENNDIWRRDPKELYENGGSVAGDKPLACCYKGWYGDGLTGYPATANAQLIAAAPDLLAALEAMVEIGYEHEDGRHPSEDKHTWGCLAKQAVLNQARAAIRKAEGEH